MNNIKKERADAGLTQEELAKLLKLNISTVAKWETGVSMPRAEVLPEIAMILKCSINDLFAISEGEGIAKEEKKP